MVYYSGSEWVDGCETIEWFDEPWDVYHFLSALYDGLYVKKPQAATFPALAGVLRLSTKYFAERVRKRCIVLLESDWPSTLAEWDAREAQPIGSTTKTYRDHYTHPAHILALAHEFDLASLLPSALYDLSRYGPSAIMAGTQTYPSYFEMCCRALELAYLDSRKNMLIPEGELESEANHVPFLDPRATMPLITFPIRLSKELLELVLKGREASQHYVAAFLTKELSGRRPSADCAHRRSTPETVQSLVPETPENGSNECAETFRLTTMTVLRALTLGPGSLSSLLDTNPASSGREADPLYTLNQCLKVADSFNYRAGQSRVVAKLCLPCKTEFGEVVKKAREEVWSLIPKWFGLEGIAEKEAPKLATKQE